MLKQSRDLIYAINTTRIKDLNAIIVKFCNNRLEMCKSSFIATREIIENVDLNNLVKLIENLY